MARCMACENGGGIHSRTCTSDTECTCGMNDCGQCMTRPGARSPFPMVSLARYAD